MNSLYWHKLCGFQVEKGELCNYAKVVNFTASSFNHFTWLQWQTIYCWNLYNPNCRFASWFMPYVKYFNFCESLKMGNFAEMLLHKEPFSTWNLQNYSLVQIYLIHVSICKSMQRITWCIGLNTLSVIFIFYLIILIKLIKSSNHNTYIVIGQW